MFLALVILGFAGCKDAGEERFLAAQAEYAELIETGIHPRDPRFDPVVSALRDVPEGSRAFARAQGLLQAIEGARAVPPRPLARGSASAEEEACAELARRLGTADAGARPALERALEECRRKAEREGLAH